jgi:type II secretion system protein G
MRKKGFTLIELLIVMLILSILITIAVVGFGSAVERAKKTAAAQMIQSIKTALEEYEQYGGYPIADYPNDAGISLVTDLLCFGSKRFLEVKEKDFVVSKYIPGKKVIADPWRTPYRYRSAYDEKGNTRSGMRNPDKFDVWSCGPDMKDDYLNAGKTTDDIGNW